MHRKLSIFATSSAKTLGERVIAEVNKIFEDADTDHRIILGKATETVFADGEVKVEIGESIRERDVYVLASPPDPISRRLHIDLGDFLPPDTGQFSREDVFALLHRFRKGSSSTIDNFRMFLAYIATLYRTDADRITAIPTFYPGSRQERPRGREPNMARLTAMELESAGAYRVMTLDIHSEAIEGFFRQCRFENLRAGRYLIEGFLAEYLSDHPTLENLSVVSPDAGGTERARYFAKQLRAPLVVSDKRRDHSKVHTVDEITIIGEVRGRDVLIPDDMIDTAGTIDKVARAVRQQGGKDIYLLCTHALLNDPATERLRKLYDEGIMRLLIASDTVHHGQAYLTCHPWLKEVSVAPLIARAIYNLNEGRSVSRLL